MKYITYEAMMKAGGCSEMMPTFKVTWPHGAPVEVSIDAFIKGGKIMKADPVWLYRLLPKEGPNSQLAFCIWLAEQVAHLHPDAAATLLPLARQHLANPGSVDVRAARHAQRAIVEGTALTERDKQIVKRKQMVKEAKQKGQAPKAEEPIKPWRETPEGHAAHAISCTLHGLASDPFSRLVGDAAPLRAAESVRKALVLSGSCVDEDAAQRVVLGKLVEMLLAA